MDLIIMTFDGLERTQTQWQTILEGIGLIIVRMEGPKAESLSRDDVIEVIYTN